MLRMTQVTKIHQGKTPVRRSFYIREWTKHRNMKQADLVRELGVDKGTVSRWFKKGMIPREEHLAALAALFHTDVAGLFRDPADDWLRRLFVGTTKEERERIAKIVELSIGRTGTDG